MEVKLEKIDVNALIQMCKEENRNSKFLSNEAKKDIRLKAVYKKYYAESPIKIPIHEFVSFLKTQGFELVKKPCRVGGVNRTYIKC